MIFLQMACVSTDQSSFFQQQPSEEIVDSGQEDTNDVPVSACPDGFSGVPSVEPRFCIMTYEAQVSDGQVFSEAGSRPSVNISFYDAQAHCHSLSYSDSNGEKTARLATHAEWQDAGDGQIGQGGTVYPWGDDSDYRPCVLPDPASGISWDDYQASGSMSDCVSEFGLYDQIGNVWEWVNEGYSINIDQWFLARSEEQITLEVSGDQLLLQSGELSEFILHVVAFQFNEFYTDDSGVLHASTVSPYLSNGPSVGYLMPKTASELMDANHLLPIRLDFEEDRLNARILLEQQRDGEPIGVKVGGAFYSGADATLQKKFYGHVPDFNGSIGFRCSVDSLTP